MWVWWLAVAFADCPVQGVPASQLTGDVDAALAAYVDQDVTRYIAAFNDVQADLECLTEVLGPTESGAVLRFWGVHATILDDPGLADAAFRAAVRTDPGGALPPPLTAAEPELGARLEAARGAEPGPTAPIRTPMDAVVRVDGVVADAWSQQEPSLIQVMTSDDVVRWTGLVTPPEERLPAWLERGELPPDTPQPRLAERLGYRMVRLRPGRFAMGSADAEPGHDYGETLHEVHLDHPFLIGATEVTQELWRAVTGKRPSAFDTAGHPVEQVSWFDAVKFCNTLSEQDGLTPAYDLAGKTVTWNRGANGYRLPTEAEWEYAARAGGQGRFSGSAAADDVAWYRDNGEGRTHVPAQKQPNAWGVYDASGNVAEWVWDWWGDYPAEATTGPTGPDAGAWRVLRGGAWDSAREDVRVAHRAKAKPEFKANDLGFRLARDP